jgi:hypothetical protein
MSSGGSVTQWIGPFKAGEEQALEKLRQCNWPNLVGLAHKRLGSEPNLKTTTSRKKHSPASCVDSKLTSSRAWKTAGICLLC